MLEIFCFDYAYLLSFYSSSTLNLAKNASRLKDFVSNLGLLRLISFLLGNLRLLKIHLWEIIMLGKN